MARLDRDSEDPMRSKLLALVPALALVVLAGCAALRQSDAMDMERSLAAAGFQMKMANTPKRLAQVESLPQRKLTRVPYRDESRFVYADEQFCKCVYVGTEAAYDRYQRLEIKQKIAEEKLEASMNWDDWGVWGPWW
jgi:hypothetical protein